MGNGFQCFGSSASQRMHVHDIASPHMGQETADGGKLRRNGNVDLATLHQIHIGRIVDQSHHLAGTESLREHR
jgi:hypothetical protein